MTYSVLRLVVVALASSGSLIALGGCSSTSAATTVSVMTDGGHLDGSSTGDGSTDGPVCTYTPIVNDPACPATYSYTYGGKACAPIGLRCGYPGAGDGTLDGCFSTAVLWCHGDADSGEAGSDAGAGTWIFGQ